LLEKIASKIKVFNQNRTKTGMGDYTHYNNQSINMNKLQQKIKSLLQEIKEQQENRYWYVATITFSTDTFYRRVNSISQFYKRLSNSKTALQGNPTNREWWQKLDPNGFYDFTPNKETIVLSFVMETKAKLNELEFKARVKKIVPYIEISIGTKEQKEYEFELAFERNFYQKYEPKTEVFGDIKKIQDLNYNKNRLVYL
jgi:hypothetical protein